MLVLLQDGRRFEGWLEASRMDGDGSRGWIRVGWFAAERLAPSG